MDIIDSYSQAYIFMYIDLLIETCIFLFTFTYHILKVNCKDLQKCLRDY